MLAGILSAHAIEYTPANVSASIALKVPGNEAVRYPLEFRKLRKERFDYQLTATESLPVLIYQKVEGGETNKRITLFITATENIYFNYGEQVKSGACHDDCLFYMPGFWYRRNLRSPKEAPSFHTSDSWVVREDRLSTPMTTIFDEKNGKSFSVARIDKFESDALTTHKEGEVILSGTTSIGYTGFENCNGTATLSFGYPYKEAPKTYIRKLTLAPSVEAYQFLGKGESVTLTWELNESAPTDFSDCVKQAWEYSYDLYKPATVETPYTDEVMKEVMSNFFVESFIGDTPTNYYSGVELHTATCNNVDVAEVGFVGRTLLNAFNALEYGESKQRTDLVANANAIFDSYLEHGFSPAGFFNEVVHYKRNFIEPVHSIRRQSEGIYATLYYLNYEKKKGRKHPEWEKRLKGMLDTFLRLQNEDGSFPRRMTSRL